MSVSSPLSKMLERVAMATACFLSVMLFFVSFSASTKRDMAEDITEEFAGEVAANGVIMGGDYERYLFQLEELGYAARLSHSSNREEPYYSYESAEEIGQYFMGRNVRRMPSVQTEKEDVEDVAPEGVTMQKFSNASVIASLSYQAYEELPGCPDGGYAAVMGTQELYVGEALVTLLYAREDGISYIGHGDSRVVSVPGVYDVPLFVGGMPAGVSIHVTVWEREAICSRGHSYTATEEVIRHYKDSGEWGLCPYCAFYAERIEVVPAAVNVPLGTPAEGIWASVNVTYCDGHTDMVSLSEVSTDYDSNYSGVQSVTVRWHGASATFQVSSIDPLCSSCALPIIGRSYADCRLYTKCSSCLSAVPMYLGKSYRTAEEHTDEEIVGALLADGKYLLGRGDELMIEVYHKPRNSIGMFTTFRDMGVLFRVGRTVRRRGE